MMDAIHDLFIYFMAGFVIFGAVCRLNAMHPDENKIGWGLMYLAAGGFAFSAALDAFATDIPDYVNICGLLAWCLNIYLTKGLWKKGVPDATKKRYIDSKNGAAQ